jgi:hypothetical protein
VPSNTITLHSLFTHSSFTLLLHSPSSSLLHHLFNQFLIVAETKAIKAQVHKAKQWQQRLKRTGIEEGEASLGDLKKLLDEVGIFLIGSYLIPTFPTDLTYFEIGTNGSNILLPTFSVSRLKCTRGDEPSSPSSRSRDTESLHRPHTEHAISL